MLSEWVKDLALLWLWCRPAATALIGPLAREPPYAASAALKRKKEREGERGAGLMVPCPGIKSKMTFTAQKKLNDF